MVFWREPGVATKVSLIMLTAAAIATCWRPTPNRLALLAATELADVWVRMPAVPNHWLLAAFVDVALLVAWTRRRDPAGLLAAVRAPLMLSVVLFYLWTGTWKLNTDFLRPEVSCAMASLDRVLTVFRRIPDTTALRRGVIAATLGMELLGPLLLLWPKTRRAMVVVFIAFHLILGLDAAKVYLNFGSVMFALLLLFLPDEAAVRFRTLLPSGARWGIRLFTLGYLALATAAVLVGPPSPIYLVGRWLVWLAYALALVGIVVGAVVAAPRPRPWLPTAGSLAIVWIVPVLIVLNGLAPLLGVKTRTSWQMYSNVRLEDAASNHLLFSRSLDLLGALHDPVTVVQSDGILFRDVAGTHMRLPWVEFRRRVAADPDVAITWERYGERHVTARAGDDPLLTAPLPLAVRKFEIFRPLGPDVVTVCDW